MDKNTQKVLEELKSGIVEEVKPEIKEAVEAVSADVVEKVYQKIKDEQPQRKGIFGGSDEEATKAEELKEQTEDTQNLVKALFKRDTSAAKTISAKYATKGLSEGVSADGGYLVPTILAQTINRIKPTVGKFRADALVIPVSTNKLTLPNIGSVTATRTAEGVAKTAVKPVIGKVDIVIKKLAAIIPLTDELINDSPSTLMGLLGTLGAEAISRKEDEWGFLGLGAGEGLFQSTTIPVFTLATGKDTYAEMTLDDALTAVGMVDEDVLDGAKWYMSWSVLASLWGKKDTAGQFLISPPTEGRPASLFGFPIVTVGVMPKTTAGSQAGTKFIAFGNLKHAVLADRQGYTLDVSNEATILDTDGTTAVNLWQQDMTAIRIVERIDIQVVEPTAFVVVKTAAT